MNATPQIPKQLMSKIEAEALKTVGAFEDQSRKELEDEQRDKYDLFVSGAHFLYSEIMEQVAPLIREVEKFVANDEEMGGLFNLEHLKQALAKFRGEG